MLLGWVPNEDHQLTAILPVGCVDLGSCGVDPVIRQAANRVLSGGLRQQVSCGRGCHRLSLSQARSPAWTVVIDALLHELQSVAALIVQRRSVSAAYRISQAPLIPWWSNDTAMRIEPHDLGLGWNPQWLSCAAKRDGPRHLRDR